MATLLQGDCLEVMKTLPDKSVDCFICDLPYGCLSGDGKGIVSLKSKCYVGQKWDVKIDLSSFWQQVDRLSKSKNTPVLMFCSMRFFGELFNSNSSGYHYSYIWKKQRGTNYMDANRKPLQDFETIAVFSKVRPFFIRFPGRCATTTLEFNMVSKKIHPTEKPLDLYTWLLERYCPAGGTVLDPTAGSFNAVKAAVALGLKGIGIEKDDGFFKKAETAFGVADSSGDTIHLID
jgi:site-specific DNA-methyltransferase (adenine-specific)